ncbi:MAG TPA: carboxy-S-adenosyl-L-methionine synthase CmoA [Candidatus Limnocylindria bacterium]|nr:carboxy-S-adenosyl-L-methionine synthase CmoA [Candidatus Limnocylindria bacterium]
MLKAVTKDEVYRAKRPTVGDFTFNRSVAVVFDDMVARSVPFYAEIQRMLVELTRDFAVPGSAVYDLGCATGTTLVNLHRVLEPTVRLVGVDNSVEMLAETRTKLEAHGVDRCVELDCQDLNEGATVADASVVLMVLTLQFIRPLRRDRLIERVFQGLRPDGAFILVEKVLGEESIFNRLFIEHYYDLKRRNGYSELEISQKREALENVLIPYKLLENRELLLRAGFRSVDVFFKWYNFCGIVAVK